MTYKEEITKLIRASYDQGAKDAQQETLAALEQIVAAVRADEREACAKVCDGLADMHAKMNQWGSHKTADTLAQAIRAGVIHDKT